MLTVFFSQELTLEYSENLEEIIYRDRQIIVFLELFPKFRRLIEPYSTKITIQKRLIVMTMYIKTFVHDQLTTISIKETFKNLLVILK